MYAAAELMEKGIDFTKIIDDSYYKKTFTQNKVLGRALSNAKSREMGQFIYSALTLKDINEFGAKGPDFEGIVNQLRITDKVKVALFLHEFEPGHFKGSLRAKDETDLNKVASIFGGGGHKKAAGFDVSLPVDEIVNRIIEAIKEQGSFS